MPPTAGLNYTPHDFRRVFITDAIMNGLPPHIAQIIAGHRDINVTLGYKAIYPDEAIQAHLAFLARRRSLRPSEEYRVPTDAEWEEFLGLPINCTSSGSSIGRTTRSAGGNVVEDVRHVLMEGLGSVPAVGAVLAGQGRSCRSSS